MVVMGLHCWLEGTFHPLHGRRCVNPSIFLKRERGRVKWKEGKETREIIFFFFLSFHLEKHIDVRIPLCPFLGGDPQALTPEDHIKTYGVPFRREGDLQGALPLRQSRMRHGDRHLVIGAFIA